MIPEETLGHLRIQEARVIILRKRTEEYVRDFSDTDVRGLLATIPDLRVTASAIPCCNPYAVPSDDRRSLASLLLALTLAREGLL